MSASYFSRTDNVDRTEEDTRDASAYTSRPASYRDAFEPLILGGGVQLPLPSVHYTGRSWLSPGDKGPPAPGTEGLFVLSSPPGRGASWLGC
ncbi:unnamed protein product [Gadus morhua 'NCC']